MTIKSKNSFFQAYQKFFLSCSKINIVTAYFKLHFMQEESLLHNKQLIPCSFNMTKDKCSNNNYIKIMLPPNTINNHFARLLSLKTICKPKLEMCLKSSHFPKHSTYNQESMVCSYSCNNHHQITKPQPLLTTHQQHLHMKTTTTNYQHLYSKK